MTKKDYIKFAALLKRTNPLNKKDSRYSLYKTHHVEEKALEQHTRIITGIMGIFKEDNPNFDEDRFLAAITNRR